MDYEPDSNGGWYLARKLKENPDQFAEDYPIEPIDPIDPTDQVYYILSHGCDTGISADVPEDCTYCIKGICGFSTHSDKITIELYNMFLKGNKIFEDPRGVNMSIKEKHNIKQYFKIHPHKNKNASTYSNSFYNMHAIWFEYDKLSKYIKNIILNESKIEKTEELYKLFTNCRFSLLPSGIMQLGWKTFKTPVEIYEEPLFNNVLFDAFIDLLNDGMDIKEIGNNEELISSYITIIIEDLFNMPFQFITGLPLKGLLARMYGHSFFPSFNDVITELKLDTELRDEYKINNIYQAHTKINSSFNISQRDLFHFFPGIYYNAVCRDKCMGANNTNIQLRRRLSANAFNLMNLDGGKRKTRKTKNRKTSKTKNHKKKTRK